MKIELNNKEIGLIIKALWLLDKHPLGLLERLEPLYDESAKREAKKMCSVLEAAQQARIYTSQPGEGS